MYIPDWALLLIFLVVVTVYQNQEEKIKKLREQGEAQQRKISDLESEVSELESTVEDLESLRD
jgi:cell division protein FtsL